jgi:membrane protein YqaA with SNARE-associated domain
MFMRVEGGGLLKNEARLYAPRIPAVEIKNCVCAYMFAARPSLYWQRMEWLEPVLSLLALPRYGLSTLFIAAFISATLLPVGSEPALYGLLRLNPDLYWSAIFVATAGNTLGGVLDWWMGYGAHSVVDKYSHSKSHLKAIEWLERMGPKACLLAWLPLVGDPLCAVAGWLRMPFWPCVGYMLIGKLLRYLIMTTVLLYFWPR